MRLARAGNYRRLQECILAVKKKAKGRSYMRDGPLREPPPIRQGISGSAVKDKNRNPEGNPRFFPGRFSSCAGTG
ncbi:hypothetical protein D9798_04515 [Salmonella enterica]|nr:hypothetical protein [Salmonella enterica]